MTSRNDTTAADGQIYCLGFLLSFCLIKQGSLCLSKEIYNKFSPIEYLIMKFVHKGYQYIYQNAFNF